MGQLQQAFLDREYAYDPEVNTAHDALQAYVNSIQTLILFTGWGMPWPTATNLAQEPTYLAALHWLYDNGFYSVNFIWTSMGPENVDPSYANRLLMGMLVLAMDQLNVLGGTTNAIAGQVDANTGDIWTLDNIWLPWVQGEIALLQQSAGDVTQAQLDNAISYSQYLYNQAVAHADQDMAAAEQQAAAQVQQAISYSQQLYNQAIAHADQDMATAEQQATNQHNQAEQDAQNAANQAQSNAQGYADRAVAVEGALNAAALAAAMVGVNAELATLTAGAASVAELAGDALFATELVQLLETGAFFAFLGLAIKEPVGTANDTVPVFQALLDPAGSMVDGIIGFLV